MAWSGYLAPTVGESKKRYIGTSCKNFPARRLLHILKADEVLFLPEEKNKVIFRPLPEEVKNGAS